MSKLGLFSLVCMFTVSCCYAEDLKSSSVIEARTGEDFTIILPANPTTGYQWQLAEPVNEKIIQLVNSEYVPDPDKIGRAGAGGKQVWRFKALVEGRTDVKLKYVRSWEKNIAPVSEKIFNVVIK